VVIPVIGNLEILRLRGPGCFAHLFPLSFRLKREFQGLTRLAPTHSKPSPPTSRLQHIRIQARLCFSLLPVFVLPLLQEGRYTYRVLYTELKVSMHESESPTLFGSRPADEPISGACLLPSPLWIPHIRHVVCVCGSVFHFGAVLTYLVYRSPS